MSSNTLSIQLSSKAQDQAVQNFERMYGFDGKEPILLKSALLTSHLKAISVFTAKEDQDKLTALVVKISKSNDLQDHLERILSLSPRAMTSYADLEKSVREFEGSDKSGLNHYFSPNRLDLLIEAYAGYGAQDLQILLKVLSSEGGGGLGYAIRSLGVSARRWNIDRDLKIIYLPEWFVGVFHSLEDNLGGKTQHVTHRLAAELLHTAIQEEFLGKEGGRSSLYRGLGGAALVAGAVVGAINAPLGVVIVVLVPQAIEGYTQIAGLNHGQGYNPAKEIFGKIGKVLAGDEGESIGRIGYDIASVVICLKGGMKVIENPGSQGELVAGYKQAISELSGVGGVETGSSVGRSVSSLEKVALTGESIQKQAFGTLSSNIKTADFSTKYGNAVFYSGYKTEEAMELATEYGRRTIEMTPGGQWLHELKLFGDKSPVNPDQAAELWRQASRRFAEQVSGPTKVYERVRVLSKMEQSTFRTVELPILQGNPNVNMLLHNIEWPK